MSRNSQLADQIEEVQNQLLELVGQLRDLAHADPRNSSWAESYIIGHLETVISENHGWLSRDQNIDDWLRMLREDDDGEELTDEEGDTK